ncbi:MAG: hypothetical protein WCP92_07025 [bacterium]
MSKAEQLYTSPAYVQQQKTTLDQILGSMNAPTVAPKADTTTPLEVQPTVTK